MCVMQYVLHPSPQAISSAAVAAPVSPLRRCAPGAFEFQRGAPRAAEVGGSSLAGKPEATPDVASSGNSGRQFARMGKRDDRRPGAWPS